MFNLMFFVFALPGMALAMWARYRLTSTFGKYSKVPTTRRMTGAQVARSLLDAYGLQHVGVEHVPGQLTDHYDPRSHTLRLSDATYRSDSVAAAGVAAHEMGHALQHAEGYAPLNLRGAMVPATNFGSNLGPWCVMGGLLLSNFTGSEFGLLIAWVGVALFGLAVLFSLVTLPVEFDASRRAKKLLHSEGLLSQDEIVGVDKVLDAAALTYVAAAISAIGTMLYYVYLLMGSRRRE
ncbi:MAG: zinc metallopeptidase [Candidatus Promineifilaceae bacterium]